LNSPTELDELLREKAQLTRMLQSMAEEEKYLGKRFRIVEEKLEIQELKEKVKAKRAVLEQLKSKIGELEKRFKEPQEKEGMEVMVKAAPAGSQQSENQTENRPRLLP
jgi:uncharacterized coiled-coil protein SlyX